MVVVSKLRSFSRAVVNLSNESGTQRLCDISFGGMRVLSTKALRMNEKIEINLSVTQGTVNLKGRVVRARLSNLEDLTYEYGFVFDGLSEQDQQRLEQFMETKGSGEVPESPVGPADLMALEQRIAELEQELAEAETEASGTRLAISRKRTPENSRRRRKTNFTSDRFERLLALDQPLMLLVPDPESHVQGAVHRKVASTFSESFDLVSVKTKLDGSASHASIIGALFDCYELEIIDFA